MPPIFLFLSQGNVEVNATDTRASYLQIMGKWDYEEITKLGMFILFSAMPLSNQHLDHSSC